MTGHYYRTLLASLLLLSVSTALTASTNPFLSFVRRPFAAYAMELDSLIAGISADSGAQWAHYTEQMNEAADRGNRELRITAGYLEVRRREALGLMSREESTWHYLELADTAYEKHYYAQALYLLFRAFENYRLHLRNYDMMFKLSVSMAKIMTHVSPHTFPPMLWYRLELGNMYYTFGADEVALRMVNPILDAPRIAVSVEALAPTYNLIGLIHMKNGRYRKARHTFTLIMERENLAQQSAKNKTLWNAIAQGNIGNAYLLDREYDKAITALRASVDSIVPFHDFHYACGRVINLAEAYIMKNKPKQAWQYIELAESYNDRSGAKRTSELFAVKAKYYALIGEPNHAFAMRDSVDRFEWRTEGNMYVGTLIEQMEEAPLSIFATLARPDTAARSTDEVASGAAFAIISILSLFVLCFYQPLVWSLREQRHHVRELFPPAYRLPFRSGSLPFRSGSAPPLSENDAAQLYNRLLKYMDDERPYLAADLTLSKLCDQLKVSRTNLSYCINLMSKKNFNEFTNQYRVQTAIRLLEEKGSQYSIDAISAEAGFRDRSTFYRAFKKETGYAPSEYMKAVAGTDAKGL
jgi:AraC-like DNA-binding protein